MGSEVGWAVRLGGWVGMRGAGGGGGVKVGFLRWGGLRWGEGEGEGEGG